VKVGTILMTQNSVEYEKVAAGATDPHAASSQFFIDELRSGELAVSLGFSGIWCVEHHFTPHGETPSPLQTLTYFAGRTPHAELGTCVVVLPWNDPVRVAEQIAVLDNMVAPDSRLTIGFGRGSAQSEFDGFDVPLSESTDRFKENFEIVRRLLTEENVTFEGRWRTIKNVTTLPRPRSADLVGRLHYSWSSRTSMEFAANNGFSPLFVAKGSPAEYSSDMAEFNAIRATHDWAPARPIISLNVFADPDPHYAREEGRKYLRDFYSNTLDHYQRLEPKHFQEAGNYAETARLAEQMAKRDRNELLDELCDLQVTGTPDEVIQQLEVWRDVMAPSEFLFAMRFGGMPYDVAATNMKHIAAILPEVARWNLESPRTVNG
jgi:alkanesulfonate monooxygenase SsuD/methylene tetrahydromethanopterin reductase-like flavin-dependent oxidoreductase (luciferase family)